MGMLFPLEAGRGEIPWGPHISGIHSLCCWEGLDGIRICPNGKGHVEPRSSSDPGGESTAPFPCREGGRSLNRHVPSEMKWFMSQRSLH